MKCQSCGYQLPDDARFCHNCGKPQLINKSALSEKMYQFCALQLKSSFTDEWWEASIGRQKIAESKKRLSSLVKALIPFSNTDGIYREGNIELVSILSNQGWEVVTNDEFGCVTAMRRLIS